MNKIEDLMNQADESALGMPHEEWAAKCKREAKLVDKHVPATPIKGGSFAKYEADTE